MSPPSRIEGYAIVSEDGMLADPDGKMPESLHFEADKEFFERGMNGIEVAVHGRHSHEQQPNSPQRHRVVVTDRIEALAPHPTNDRAVRWNPKGAAFEEALAALGLPGASVGVVGGTRVFGLFLDRFDVFYLTRAPGLRLPGGRPVFPDVPERTPEDVLAGHGLRPDAPLVLDASKDLAVVAWRR